MKIELLYFDGCPSYRTLRPRLRELIESAGVDAGLDVRRVESAEAAASEAFLGSPTVRVDGQDVEPSAEARNDYGLKCRLYQTPRGLSGMPDDDWILAALGRRGER